MGLQLTAAQLHQLFPTLPAPRAAAFAPHLNAALAEFAIADTAARVAAWAAQVGHESADLTTWEEGFGYTAERLIAVFGSKRFPSLDVARLYAGDRAATASRVYAHRLGNGSESTGDGWRFRGRGPIQITGRENYRACGRALGLDLEADPDLLALPEHGFRAAGWFWSTRQLNDLADVGAFEQITRRINGGLRGQADRLARWSRAKALLGV